MSRRDFLIATSVAMAVTAVASAEVATSQVSPEKHMDIQRVGSKPSGKGPAEWFTGTVRIDPLFDRPEPSRVSGASVTFEPGARTAWHTHPLGQTLIVTSGFGWVQREGGPVEESAPATSCGSRRTSATGTVPRQPPQ